MFAPGPNTEKQNKILCQQFCTFFIMYCCKIRPRGAVHFSKHAVVCSECPQTEPWNPECNILSDMFVCMQAKRMWRVLPCDSAGMNGGILFAHRLLRNSPHFLHCNMCLLNCRALRLLKETCSGMIRYVTEEHICAHLCPEVLPSVGLWSQWHRGYTREKCSF